MTCTHCGKDMCAPCWKSRMDRHKAFERGWLDCQQDGSENAPFARVGGLSSREAPTRPKYVEPHDWPAYLFGYSECARDSYGPEWPTVGFGWKPAMVINVEK
jgi:hypothetical protein